MTKRVQKKSIAREIGAMAAEIRQRETAITFPTRRFDGPGGVRRFAETILGVELLDYQEEMVELALGNTYSAIRSGRKIGKTFCQGVAALYHYCTASHARVHLTSSSFRQIDDIQWVEVERLARGSGRCLDCKRDNPNGPRPCPHSAIIAHDSEINGSSRTGLESPDKSRSIKGHTAAKGENMQGDAGAEQFYLADEASGCPAPTLRAVMGNIAGGGRVSLWGNPTSSTPENIFFRAFHGDLQTQFKTVTIPSTVSPNVRFQDDPSRHVSGLAEPQWLAAQDPTNPYYTIHVLGRHVLNEEGRVNTIAVLEAAQARWAAASTDLGARLQIGVDPAGAGGQGDYSVFSVVRGSKQVDQLVLRGLSDEAHLVHLLGLVSKHIQEREPPAIVTVEYAGVGVNVYRTIKAYFDGTPGCRFHPFYVKPDDAAQRQPHIYQSARAEMWAVASAWLKTGAIAPDEQLARELAAAEWLPSKHGKLSITDKRDLKKLLGGKSSDRADALSLALYVRPAYLVTRSGAVSPQISPPAPKSIHDAADFAARGVYGASDAFLPFGARMGDDDD